MDQIWGAFIVEDDGALNVLCWAGREPGSREPYEMTPMIATDQERLDTIVAVAPLVARELKRRVKIIRFSAREDLETFDP
jgi:hypothetical protein